MPRILPSLGALRNPAWWRHRYGDAFNELLESARPGRRQWDLARGIVKLEMKRWQSGPRRNSDFMLDAWKTLQLEYCAANTGTTVLAIHESIINHGGNSMPEFLTCTHEESAVAMAHGYAQMEGKPMLVLLHGTIGLQHAAMAIHNAHADRAPVYLVVGNGARGFREHSARDIARNVREDLKWDDEPRTMEAFSEAAMRAYKIAMTPPMGPVMLVLDQLMQEMPFTEAHVELPRLALTRPPQADSGAVREAAKLLVAAQRPLIIVHRAARTPAFLDLLVELAETLQAPVRCLGRVSFPNHHPLAGAGGPEYQPDVILALEADELTNSYTDTQVIRISTAMSADVEATLPALIDECRLQMRGRYTRVSEERGASIAEQHRKDREARLRQADLDAQANPLGVNRVCSELWPLIRNEDWSLVSGNNLPTNFWNFDRLHRSIAGPGGHAHGYGTPIAVGAALANRRHGRLSISLQTPADLMYGPGVLWTAAHHRIPLLTIVLNDGTHSDVQFAQLGRSFGMHAEEIDDPRAMSAALLRGIQQVIRGEPSLIHLVTT